MSRKWMGKALTINGVLVSHLPIDRISIQKMDGKGTNNKCKGSSFLLKHLSQMFKAATTTRSGMHRKHDHNLIKSGTEGITKLFQVRLAD
ncbi:hypothetical protein GIB67_000766 [Kingdonia uniflora]|uniref:Uncharacterized protein n=1 Tax=Kingdonia uniflora TaxID=39325 RepID=A0A7J7NDX9_9MAGN|nr:hypothetical protein GIB67_000766 [Kingdonia uniflora]